MTTSFREKILELLTMKLPPINLPVLPSAYYFYKEKHDEQSGSEAQQAQEQEACPQKKSP